MTYLLILVALWSALAGVFWLKLNTIVWWEWLLGTIIGILVTVTTWYIIKNGRTHDIEMWSGTVSSAIYIPEWVSHHERAVYRTVINSKGNSSRVFSHYETYYVTHSPEYSVNTTLGTFNISKDKFSYLVEKFGGKKSVSGHRPSYHSGDRNDYHTVNNNNWEEPCTDLRSFENKIKAAQSTFSFPEVPKDVPVFKWPELDGVKRSERLLGRARQQINILEFDRMNSRLGPFKKVNVIIIGFPESSSTDIATLQEAAWIGGKKNDLVLCYGGKESSKWSYVFGWTDEMLVKRNLETILLQNPINDSILPLIETEIRKNYKLKDWSQFDYISVPMPWWSYLLTILLLSISQGIFYYFAHNNDVSKDSKNNARIIFKGFNHV